MKITIVLAMLILLPLGYLQAEEDAELKEGPCNKVREACKAYIKNTKDKKSLYRDCLQPLLNNEKIEAVKVDDSAIKACQLKKAELKQKK